MKQIQDLSIEEFDLFARCVEAAAKFTITKYRFDGYSIPIFHANRIRRTLEFRYKFVSSYEPEKYSWTFDSKEGLSGPDKSLYQNAKEFYVLYRLFALYFLDDETILNQIDDWEPSLWDSEQWGERYKIDKLYKTKAIFLGAKCSGGNRYGSELEKAYLYKVKWVTHRSEIKPDFTRVLSQHEYISLTRYSMLYRLLYEEVKMSSGEAMGVLRKIDKKITNYFKRRYTNC